MNSQRKSAWVGLMLAASAGIASTASAQNVRIDWTGGGDGRSWSDARNWLTVVGANRVPATDDLVFIDSANPITINYDPAANPPNLWSFNIKNATLNVQTVQQFRINTVRDIVVDTGATIRGRAGTPVAKDGGNVTLETVQGVRNGKIDIKGEVRGGVPNATGKGGSVWLIGPANIATAVNITGAVRGANSPQGDGGSVEITAARGGVTANTIVGGDAGPGKHGGSAKITAGMTLTLTNGVWSGGGGDNPAGRGGDSGHVTLIAPTITNTGFALVWPGSGGDGTGAMGGNGGHALLLAETLTLDADIKSGAGGDGTTGGTPGDVSISPRLNMQAVSLTNRGRISAGAGGSSTANAGRTGGNVSINTRRLLNLGNLASIRSGLGGWGTRGAAAGVVNIMIQGANSDNQGQITGGDGGHGSNGNGGAGGSVVIGPGSLDNAATGVIRGGRGGPTDGGGRGGLGGDVRLQLAGAGNAGLIQGGHGSGAFAGPALPGGDGGSVTITQPAAAIRNTGRIFGGDGATLNGRGGTVTARGGAIIRVGTVRGGKNGRGPEGPGDTYANVTLDVETALTFEAQATLQGGDILIGAASGALIQFQREVTGEHARLTADDDITITLPCGTVDLNAWRSGDGPVFVCDNDPIEMGLMRAPDEDLIVLRNGVVFDDLVRAERPTTHEPSACGGFCYADCDQSTGPRVLDIFDFLCFQNRFAALDPYACDCDVSSGAGRCDIFDFLCFQNAYASGCP